MNSKTEQIATTQTITKIQEKVQIEQWQKDIEDRQTADLSIRLCLLTTFFELHGGLFGGYFKPFSYCGTMKYNVLQRTIIEVG